MEIIKPKVCDRFSCVYEMIIDRKYFYIGSTVCLNERSEKHIYKINKRKHTISIMKVVSNSSNIEFKILEVINDSSILRIREKYFITKSIFNKLCLNKIPQSFEQKVFYGKRKIAIFNSALQLINIYPSINFAAKSLFISSCSIRKVLCGTQKAFNNGCLVSIVNNNGTFNIPKNPFPNKIIKI
jgi:hypothetical protein